MLPEERLFDESFRRRLSRTGPGAPGRVVQLDGPLMILEPDRTLRLPIPARRVAGRSKRTRLQLWQPAIQSFSREIVHPGHAPCAGNKRRDSAHRREADPRKKMLI